MNNDIHKTKKYINTLIKNKKYLKKEAIFLEFSDSLDANLFCQDLVKDL